MSTSAVGAATADQSHGHSPQGSVAKLALGAVGVVYGDIGTSPLYALKECFTGEHGLAVRPANVFGILSLVTWSLILVIITKYLSFMMRADNRGEGGMFALLALVIPKEGRPSRGTMLLTLLGVFGAALLYGDGVITPAISVLSAVEGLEFAQLSFTPPVVPVTVGILLALFLFQRRGTAGVGAIFGPATLLWFLAIALAGAGAVFKSPQILGAMSPLYALEFFRHHQWGAIAVLGSVVLCVTGGEALYADMGHFGRKPIRVAWFAVVFPALLLNYFGQGALLLTACADARSAQCRHALESPFFRLVPAGAPLYLLVAIATVATIVASQAMISGAFSLTQQAVQLGFCPRVNIVHTSQEAEGQIYIPEVNWAIMVACICLVVYFQKSERLAAAYGFAVTGSMTITSVLFFAVAIRKWRWSVLKAGLLVALFLLVDLTFFTANVLKIPKGGWIPLAMGAVVFTFMTTWKRGRARLAVLTQSAMAPLDSFIADVAESKPVRVKGTAVFMTQNVDGVPPVLLHHYKHNKVLHESVVLLCIRSENVPEVRVSDRAEVEQIGEGFARVIAHYGFMQTPNVPELLRSVQINGTSLRMDDTSFYLGRETFIISKRAGMMRWQKILFALMSKNARAATAFFGLPPNRVVELGTQVEL